jgi:hypothetical protein
MVKTCKECRHEYVRCPMMPFQYCTNKECIDDSLSAVLGYLPCMQARAKDGKCGIEGKCFEEIPEPPSFWSKVSEWLNE